MRYDNLKILETFNIHSLPNLDVVVLGALEYFSKERLTTLKIDNLCKKPLVVGSGNASATGRILFNNTLARYSEAGDFDENLKAFTDIDCVVIISASGGKHAVNIARKITKNNTNLPLWLLTNNKDALAKEFVDKDNVIVFPKNREPYTYNTSTYLSMILSQTKEDPKDIYTHIDSIKKLIPNDLGKYSSFVLIVPSEFDEIRSMLRTKFDELFGGNISGRVFTSEEVKHAKTIIKSKKELHIDFSALSDVKLYNENHIHIPLREKSMYGEMLSVGYFVIGKIQEAHPAYFKESIVEYTKDASEIFNQVIKPIVE